MKISNFEELAVSPARRAALEIAEAGLLAIDTGKVVKEILKFENGELAVGEKKINLKDVLYIASHGLEWEENDKYHVKPIPEEMIDAINLAKEKIKPLAIGPITTEK